MARKKKDDDNRKRSVFVVSPPPDDEGQYILLVSRSGGMMGGTQTAAFGVDRLTTEIDPSGKAIAVKGWLDDMPNPTELVVEFPAGTSYLLVRRGAVRVLTMAELTTEQREEDKEIEAILAATAPGSDVAAAVLAGAPGHGQYL